STMLGLLVDLWKRLRKRGGRLVISGVARELERLFEITNLNTIFTFAADRQAALKALSVS
ncbi:MAG TPA: STAS domain-containing protein, partial [Phycisphaerales bacterium]|nr:STAS domain-containing protein [Phycisphaerales bacterium]